ncbi:MAG: hypothetical protein UV94_C0003G0067 [Parcubacteria group bacterium GW2011_GWC1_43_30]|nr:MAG: hypothetical protein UV94_C0003G0067 [Parcubacteria group bacterium GW2011_GWC1_43_30]
MNQPIFKEQGTLDRDLLKHQLSSLIGEELTSVTATYEPTGYTGNVYFVDTVSKSGSIYKLVVKRMIDTKEWNLYTDFLKPYNLNSPVHIGKIKLDRHEFLVMERIDSKLKLLDHKVWLKNALNWLIRKDTVCSKDIKKVSKIDPIKQNINTGEGWWPIIEKCVSSKLHPLIDKSLYKKLLGQKEVLAEYNEALQSGIQTVVHNDFQKRNTLIDKRGVLFVIDWSNPNIGSICIDLARLIEANHENARDIRKQYARSINVDHFETLLSMAKFRNTFSIFVWMCKAIIDGQREAVEKEYDIRRYIEILTMWRK